MLATNGVLETFVMFLYGEIQWTTVVNDYYYYPEDAEAEALAGINDGDGINSYTIPGSLTSDIIDITETSNVGIPGTWMYQLNCGKDKVLTYSTCIITR